MLGELAGSTSSGRSTTSSSGCSSRRPSRSRSATRCRATAGSARSSTRRPSTATSRRSSEARRDGTVFTGGEHLTDGDLARGFYVEPTVVGDLPADHRLFRDELFAPFTAVVGGRLARRGAARSPTTRMYGLTAGVYSEDPDEVRSFLDASGRRPVRQPASGRDDRRVAGRAAVRRLEGLGLDGQGRAVDVLRRASSCASRATRSSTEPQRRDREVRLRDDLHGRSDDVIEPLGMTAVTATSALRPSGTSRSSQRQASPRTTASTAGAGRRHARRGAGPAIVFQPGARRRAAERERPRRSGGQRDRPP